MGGVEGLKKNNKYKTLGYGVARMTSEVFSCRSNKDELCVCFTCLHKDLLQTRKLNEANRGPARKRLDVRVEVRPDKW